MILSPYPVLIALLAGLLSAAGTWALLPWLRRYVIDLPNARSNHKAPVPRGGGIAMIGAALLGLYLAGARWPILAATLLLAGVSFIDDRYGLGVRPRLFAQILALMLALSGMQGHLFAELPHWLETVLTGLAWLWFINLTNFMDGIDGISAMEAVMICAGICLLHVLHSIIPLTLATQAAVLAAAAYGFYCFNRSPAKLFLGDVGSIPLGFLLGYLLLSLAQHHYLIPALILPAYYVSDATATLARRLLRGRKIWQAHSEHAYQQAVRRGFTHAQVVSRISWLNALLIILAMGASVSMMAGIAALACAYALTFGLLYHFTHAQHA